jgi:hypothetical protein
MFNSTGQLIMVQQLYSPNETVSLKRLQKRGFILHIQQEGKKEFTGKSFFNKKILPEKPGDSYQSRISSVIF